MYKKGVSHIEILFAFIIFVGFLVFALYFFNPFNTDRVLDSTLFYAYDELETNVSVTLESYSIVFDTSVIETIVSFPLTPETSGSVRVLDSADIVISAHYDSGSNSLEVDRGSERFIKALFSDAFSATTPLSGVTPLISGYTISSSELIEVVSEDAILALNATYNSDYVGLKQDFNLPGRTDFAFSLDFDDGGSVSVTRAIPSNLEVFTERKQVHIVRSDGSLTLGYLEVKVW